MYIATWIKKGELLEVVETQYSWTETKRTFWYYDTVNNLKSITGKQNEVPSVLMNDSQIEWMRKYYIPKAEARWEQERKEYGTI